MDDERTRQSSFVMGVWLSVVVSDVALLLEVSRVALLVVEEEALLPLSSFSNTRLIEALFDNVMSCSTVDCRFCLDVVRLVVVALVLEGGCGCCCVGKLSMVAYRSIRIPSFSNWHRFPGKKPYIRRRGSKRPSPHGTPPASSSCWFRREDTI